MTYLNSAFAAVFLLFCNVVSSAAAEPIASFPQLHEKFLAGLKLVDGEKFGDAGDTFAELNTLARELKIQGLPDYSSELLDRAALLADAQRSSESAYIIRQAIQLSPSDPQTLFRASEFEVVLGHELALSYFFSGLRAAANRPTLVATALRNGLLLLLVSGTLSLLVVAVIQLVCNVKRVIINATRKASIYSRGMFTPIIFLSLMILPLFGGLLVAIGCWCLLLSRFIKECRSLGLIAGVVILGWGLAIPTLQGVTVQLFSPLTASVQRQQFNDYSPSDIPLLKKEAGNRGHDPLVLFSLGSGLYRAGELVEADEWWSRLSDIEEGTGWREISAAALINRSAIAFTHDDIQAAKDLLLKAEKIGGQRFETAYNLSRVALAQLDTIEHDLQFENARNLDSARLSSLDQSSDGNKLELLTVEPAWNLYALRLLKPVAGEDTPKATAMEMNRKLLVSKLITGANSASAVMLLGGVVLLIGWWGRSKGERDFYRFREGALDHSLIWAIVPAGPFIVGERPGLGLVLLSIVVGLCITAMGEPTLFVSTSSQGLSFDMYWLVIAVLVALGSSGAALFSSRVSRMTVS